MRVMTCNRLIKGLPDADDRKEYFDSEENETHAAVLDKMLAWEKKLYNKVKLFTFTLLDMERDHVSVYYENLSEVVDEAVRLVGLLVDIYFSAHVDNEDGTPIGGASLSPPFPSCTLRDALARYADVLSSPKKVYF
ncbi:NADPH cytochrome P450 reductase [Artemisia annua]|uniref:NADPH cytochrome P450 reductase n=1 Tax=Artemisia annua TaxID=35608 RepID=A0A2U1MKH9_ARTAN|nr:NADPH cytochrome P450 reductase [Artemisia annua]